MPTYVLTSLLNHRRKCRLTKGDVCCIPLWQRGARWLCVPEAPAQSSLCLEQHCSGPVEFHKTEFSTSSTSAFLEAKVKVLKIATVNFDRCRMMGTLYPGGGGAVTITLKAFSSELLKLKIQVPYGPPTVSQR